MSFWLWGVLAAFACGFAVSALNFFISRYVLQKHPQLFASLTTVRMLMSIACFAVAYFVAPLTPWDFTYLLVGAALGLTVPMIFFTASLVRMIDKTTAQSTQQEGEHHG